MYFEINNQLWKIVEIEQTTFWDDIGENIDYKRNYFGRTQFEKQEIWLWESLPKESKRRTLLHELMHCYVGS